MRALRVSPSAAAVLLACLLVTGGCAGKDDSPAASDPGDSPAAPASTEPPTGTPTDSPSVAPTTAAPAEPASLADRLLPTAEVPGLNASWHWQDGETGPAATEPFGFCAKADLGSIGATEVVERSYFPPDDSDDSAAEQVAEFPDSNTAGRAWSVLKSWHDKCGRSVSADIALKARPLTAVAVPTGTARWGLLSWQPPGEETGRFETFGMVLAGTRIAVLRMDHSGQDHNYPAGQDPMVAMVRAAAARLA